MSGFTLPEPDGRKHYTVEIVRWGRETSRILLAMNANEARYLAVPRRRPAEYVSKVRRTRSDELAAVGYPPKSPR